MTARRVSVIATVKDEAQALGPWLRGLESQRMPPDEVIIVDGGSSDGTWEQLNRWNPPFPVSLVQCPGANISQGRNVAIGQADCDIVAVTDAGTIADLSWLEELLEPLADPNVDVVAGFFQPALRDAWTRSLAAATLPDADEIRARSFQPSSRSVAFRRSWWSAGVRYPEWLDYCEDLVWDMAMRRAGARFVTNTNAIVVFDVRPSLKSFMRQYYLYARGDGKAGLFALRHLVRYMTYGLAAAIAVRRNRVELCVATLFAGLYVLRPVIRLVSRDRRMGIVLTETVTCLPITIALMACGDVAKMAGYPAGLHSRWRSRRAIGWKTSWKRISPSGDLLRPGEMSKGNQPQSLLLDDESPRDLT